MPELHRLDLAGVIPGEIAVGHRRAPRTFGLNRRCAAEGCDTVLSRYNSGDHCSLHGEHRLQPLHVRELHVRELDVREQHVLDRPVGRQAVNRQCSADDERVRGHGAGRPQPDVA